MAEFTEQDREDVSELLTGVVDEVVDEFMDSGEPSMMYKYYSRFVKATAYMVVEAGKQGGSGFEDEMIERAQRVLERFGEIGLADDPTWNWQTDPAYKED